jgi:hypothetical protein
MDANWALAVLTFGLILVTGYYAWQNKRLVDEMHQQNAIAKDGLRVQLYDRRAAILGAVAKLSETALQKSDLPLEIVERFAREVGAARYLLDEAEASIISQMIKRGIVVSTRAETLRRKSQSEDAEAAMRDRQLADLLWLGDQARNLTGRFAKYLKLGSL